MDYLVNGWNTYHFLISPNELEEILAHYHLVIFNAHVPIDYTESNLHEYISAYSELYDLLLSGRKIEWEKHHSLFLHRGITSDLSNCIYGKLHVYEGKQYKSADFNEPVVGISPTALWLHIDKDKKLHCSTAYSYAFYSEYYMGVQLEYPKTIQYKAGDEYETLRTTENLGSYQDFEKLKNAIKKVSHILTIKTANNVTRRTNIWVSDEVKNRINASYSFRENGITVK